MIRRWARVQVEGFCFSRQGAPVGVAWAIKDGLVIPVFYDATTAPKTGPRPAQDAVAWTEASRLHYAGGSP